jgi:hypothetical protein
MAQDTIQVLCIIEYTGPRDWVEHMVTESIQGTKVIRSGGSKECVVIRAATIGTYPEILELVKKSKRKGG